MTPVAERLKSQILTINKLIRRDFSTDPARNEEIVNRFVSFLIERGTVNVLDLKKYENEAAGLSFFYDERSGKLFTDQKQLFNSDVYVNVTKDVANGLLNDDLFTVLGWDNRWSFYVFLKFTEDGYPVFFTATTDAGSDWADIRTGLIFLASVVVSFAIPGASAAIGTAVMGAEMAAAYPLVASAIGNAVMQTALNGGDVEKAAISAATGAAGGAVGGAVASASDSAMIGTAAAAATKALLTGADLEKAVAGALVSYGAQNAGSIVQSIQQAGSKTVDLFSSDNSFTSDGGFNLDPLALNPAASGVTYDYTFDDTGAGMTTGFAPGASMFDPLYQAPPDFLADAGWNYTAPDFSNPSLNVPSTPGGGVFNTQTVVGQNDDDSWLQDLTGAAMAALKVYTVYQQSQGQIQKPVTRTANGSTVTANSNGTVTTRSATGQVTIAKPAIGTPFVLPNGNTMVNNGDGTYSTVTPTGAVTRTPYAQAGGVTAGLPSWALPAAGGLALLLLLKK